MYIKKTSKFYYKLFFCGLNIISYGAEMPLIHYNENETMELFRERQLQKKKREENMYFTKGIICAADIIVLVFSTLFFLSNLFLTNEFFSLTDVKSMNYDMNINGTYVVDYLCLLNSTMENRNVTFSLDKINNLPLYQVFARCG
jgi:hypothetical protein